MLCGTEAGSNDMKQNGKASFSKSPSPSSTRYMHHVCFELENKHDRNSERRKEEKLYKTKMQICSNFKTLQKQRLQQSTIVSPTLLQFKVLPEFLRYCQAIAANQMSFNLFVLITNY